MNQDITGQTGDAGEFTEEQQLEFLHDLAREQAYQAGYADCAAGTAIQAQRYAGGPYLSDYDRGFGTAQCDRRDGTLPPPLESQRVDRPAPVLMLVPATGRRYRARHRMTA